MKLRLDKRQKRQEEAKARQEAYDKLSPAQKLKLLDKKFGPDCGAKRQRARLAAGK